METEQCDRPTPKLSRSSRERASVESESPAARLPEVDLVQPLLRAQEPKPVVVRDRDEGPHSVRHDALICAEGVTFARGGRETARRPYEYS